MSAEYIIIALIVISGISLLAQPVSRWLHLPYSSTLVISGFVFSELIIFFGIDTGIRADNFQSMVFYVFIPVLVFGTAFNIDKRALKKDLFIILSLSIIVMLLTCGISAVLLFYGIGHESGFPWLAALITGSILAATDPGAVVEKLKGEQLTNRVGVLLEGESLFNDATAIVLFSLFVTMAVSTTAGAPSSIRSSDTDILTAVTVNFLTIFFGGALTGLMIGLLFGYLKNKAGQPRLAGVMSLLVAYGSYMLADYLMLSGVMSTLMAALAFSVVGQSGDKVAALEDEYLWNLITHLASISVFIIVGAIITFDMFEQRWLAILIAIAAILFARVFSILGVLSVFSFFKNQKVTLAAQGVMIWGGLRGAVVLALALSLPTNLDYWWTIQSIAFGVVMFSLFVQAPTIGWLVKKLLY